MESWPCTLSLFPFLAFPLPPRVGSAMTDFSLSPSLLSFSCTHTLLTNRYVLPRGMESLWSVLRRRSYVPFVPGGEVLMTR